MGFWAGLEPKTSRHVVEPGHRLKKTFRIVKYFGLSHGQALDAKGPHNGQKKASGATNVETRSGLVLCFDLSKDFFRRDRDSTAP